MSSCVFENREDLFQVEPPVEVSFSNDVLPIIQANCVSCHQGSNPSGGVLVVDYDDVKAIGTDGRLLGTLKAEGYSLMPQTGSLLPAQIETIESWVNNGMPNN